MYCGVRRLSQQRALLLDRTRGVVNRYQNGKLGVFKSIYQKQENDKSYIRGYKGKFGDFRKNFAFVASYNDRETSIETWRVYGLVIRYNVHTSITDIQTASSAGPHNILTKNYTDRLYNTNATEFKKDKI